MQKIPPTTKIEEPNPDPEWPELFYPYPGDDKPKGRLRRWLAAKLRRTSSRSQSSPS